MIVAKRAPNDSPAANWQAGFLELLPAIRKQARRGIRGLREEAREEAIAEVVASVACAYARLIQRGEVWRAFASPLVQYGIRQYFEGRRTGSSSCSQDAYSPIPQKRAGYELQLIGSPGEREGTWRECLIDNRRTPVPDQASFRIDFPRWLRQLAPRDKKIAECLALEHSTSEVAREFGLSPSRVSQLRRELAKSWRAFIAARAPTIQAQERVD